MFLCFDKGLFCVVVLWGIGFGWFKLVGDQTSIVFHNK